MPETCKIDGCERPAWVRGWCKSDYAKANRSSGFQRAIKRSVPVLPVSVRKEHRKQQERRYLATPNGRARKIWQGMKARAGKYGSYKQVEIRMTQNEFLAWAIPELEKWFRERPNETPSIDRVEQHYEMGKIRIIEFGENCRVQPNHKNVNAPEGMAWCRVCKDYLGKDNFHKNSTNYNKLDNACKDHHGPIPTIRGRYKTKTFSGKQSMARGYAEGNF